MCEQLLTICVGYVMLNAEKGIHVDKKSALVCMHVFLEIYCNVNECIVRIFNESNENH